MIVADFQREYGKSPEDLYAMQTLRFLWFLNGLSEKSRWMRLHQDKHEKKATRHAKRSGGRRR